MKEKKHCKECGRELLETLENAENWFNDDYAPKPYPKFNPLNGKKAKMRVYSCPNRKQVYKNFWGNEKVRQNKKHDRYATKSNF